MVVQFYLNIRGSRDIGTGLTITRPIPMAEPILWFLLYGTTPAVPTVYEASAPWLQPSVPDTELVWLDGEGGPDAQRFHRHGPRESSDS